MPSCRIWMELVPPIPCLLLCYTYISFAPHVPFLFVSVLTTTLDSHRAQSVFCTHTSAIPSHLFIPFLPTTVFIPTLHSVYVSCTTYIRLRWLELGPLGRPSNSFWDNEECIRCRHKLSRSATGPRPGNGWNPGVGHRRTPEIGEPPNRGRTQAGLGEVCKYVDVANSM